MLFDRICRENGIRHLLTAPHSPTSTGKVERFHKTMKAEFLTDRVFDTVEDAQEALDRWVHEYNHEREHQSLGDRPPIARFRLAHREALEPVEVDPALPEPEPEVASAPRSTRRVGGNGRVSFATFHYHVGRWLAGETVEVTVEDGLVQIHHRGVLVATHARRHPVERSQPGDRVRADVDPLGPASP